MLRKTKVRIKRFFVLLFLLGIAGVSGAVFLTSTKTGLSLITHKLILDHIPAEDISFVDVSGNLSDELVFSQMELKNLRWFPEGTVIRLQRVVLRIRSFSPKGLEVDFDNIRVFMPYSDPIVISGTYRGGHLSANAYSRSVSIEEFLTLIPRKLSHNPKGVIRNVDLDLEGPAHAVLIKGGFLIEDLVLPHFALKEVPGDLAIVFHRSETGFSPRGEISAQGGRVQTKSSQLRLLPSSLELVGSFANPIFDIRGNASIGRVDIEVSLRGGVDNPQWRFTSNPPMQEEVLMLMFVTGKNLETVQTSVEQRRMTPDLAKDMVDYFLLGGEGGRFAQKMGIKDVSIIYDKDVTGIGVKKEVTGFLDVGYQVEQYGSDSDTADLKHTLGADVRLNRHFSLQLDKELFQYHNEERSSQPIRPDDRILLKFRRWF